VRRALSYLPFAPSRSFTAGLKKRVTPGAKVELQLVDAAGDVVHRLPVVQICGVGRSLKPTVVLSGAKVRELGLAAAFLLKATNGSLIYEKGAATTVLPLPLLLVDAEIGDPVELDEGLQTETIRKIRAIKLMGSTGVAGKPATVDATLRFELREHAPVVPAAAAGGGGGGR
jgi:hypothetical protein